MVQISKSLFYSSTRLRAALASLVVAVILVAVKFVAFFLTGSQAVFSDALENLVNVIAAIGAFTVIRHSSRPADENHPYGHGKVEFFSSAFEGGLIVCAGLVIAIESVPALWSEVPLRQIDLGLYLVAVAGCINLGLGFYLRWIGARVQSPALVASGQHLKADFFISAGVVVGLLAVKFTGLILLDALVALGVAVHLFHTGARVVRQSLGGLMDERDEKLLGVLQRACASVEQRGIIQLHHARVMQGGGYHHIDLHVVLPEFWDVNKAHHETREYARQVMKRLPWKGEIYFHHDPCRRKYCRTCTLVDCPIRVEEFSEIRPPRLSEMLSTKEPTADP